MSGGPILDGEGARFSIQALQEPFAGITRIQPDAFNQLANTFKGLSQSGADVPH
jgi:hypothetical protein